MKLKSLFLALLVMFSGVAMAQVQSGKVYRIVSSKYGTVITENLLTHQLSCVDKGADTDFQQMWEFALNDENGKYVISNVLTRRILQNESTTNVQFKTGTDSVYFAVKENTNPTCKGSYNIDASNKSGGWGLHCAGHAVVVPWSYGPDKDGISGSEWVFEEVSITDVQKEEAYLEYQAYNSINENKAAIIEKVSALFTDNTGTALKSEHAKKSDAELLALMEDVPEGLQQAILKVKNNKWNTTTREKDFRVYTYKPYSDPTKWNEILYTRLYSAIDNPTGICSSSDKDYLYVWVEDIPEGAYVELREVPATRWDGNHTRLTKGLNIVPTSIKDGFFYICYVANTHTGFSLATKSGPKKLSDYKPIKIHIEGGYVNGFWSKERGHTNEDWAYMKQNMFKNPNALQAKGTHTLLSFRTYEFLKECPTNIEGIIRLWDFWNKTQQKYMALDNYYDYFNNLQLAMSDDTGFMDAGNWRTHYNNNTLNTIVNYDLLIRDAGSSWGPNHEIGHNNQYAFEIVGTSEVSNNALANMVIFDQGTHTSRGVNLNDQILDFENNVPYVLRGEKEYGQKLFSMTRMYFQLFLYAHAVGKCPDFYPTLFEKLRRDRLVGWSVGSSDELDENGFYKNSVNAAKDQLKFAEACCEILQMDLSEFFEAWGFFIPFKNGFVGDYGHHWVYLLEEDVKACKERMQKYPKKGGHLMFIEDRVRNSKKKKSEINPNDDSSYRIDYSWEYPIGEWAGFFGQWEDYKDETVKVQDGAFFYAVVGNKIVIKQVGDKKGVLGFKLYDGNGKLLSYTNRYEMNIPLTADRSSLRVVAAQPDGTDAEIKHIKDGPANLQKEALTNSLASAKKYLDRKTDDDDTVSKKTIGKFHAEALAELQTIYNNAKADSDKIPAQREKTDVEWSEMLDAECQKVANDANAMIRLEEGAKFILKGKNNKYLERTGNGVIAQNSQLNKTPYAWSIEYADVPGCFYLKDKDGMYMRDFSIGDMVDSNEQNTATAQKFTFGYTDEGKVFFSSYPNATSFGVDDSGGVVKMALTESGTWWTAQYISDDFKNETDAFYAQEFANTLAAARVYVEEIIDPAGVGTMNIFSNKIIVLDETLTFAAQELYNTYMQAANDVENVSKHKEYLNVLREKIYNVQGKYIVKAPVTTYEGKVMWYRIRNNDNGNYLSVNAENELVPVADYEVDDNALWCFAPVSGDQYEMYSAAAKGFIYSEGTNLHAGSQERVPVTITYDESKEAVTIAMDAIINNKPQKGLILQESGSVVKLARSKKYWVLELVAVEDNEELAGELFLAGIEDVVEEVGNYEGIYDLQGRKIINPARGIYIQNGKKVIFE